MSLSASQLVLWVFCVVKLYPIFSRSYCKLNEHIEGRWRRVNQTIRLFPCVQSPENAFEVRGTLNETVLSRQGCECDTHLDQFEADERLMYEWRPTSCDLHSWDANKFCELLGERTILFIGDSTMQQIAVTTMNIVASTGGKCGSQLSYGRSNYLVHDVKNVDRRWNHYHEESPVDIIIISAGPWYQDLGDMEWGLHFINETLTRWRSEGIKIPKIYWKTQNPGHASCDEFNFPISTHEEKLMDLSHQQSEYHWNLFPTYDDMAKTFFKDIGVDIIDMYPLFLRPDGHPGKYGTVHKIGDKHNVVDCLHYCTPGPLDLFSILLYHLLIDLISN